MLFLERQLLPFLFALRITFGLFSVSTSLRYRQRFSLKVPRINRDVWAVAHRQWGAISRSVDWSRLAKVVGIVAAVTGLWLWRWELVTATTLGIGVMGGIYLAYDLPWSQYLEEFYRLWQGQYQRLGVSVLSGALAMVGSYGAIALWQSMDNHVLAAAVGIQTVILGAILLISIRQAWGGTAQNQQFETALDNLGHDSLVKRLAAIRYLRQSLKNHSLKPKQKKVLSTFLRLAWQQETDLVLREALLSTLSLYEKAQHQASSSVPLVDLRSVAFRRGQA